MAKKKSDNSIYYLIIAGGLFLGYLVYRYKTRGAAAPVPAAVTETRVNTPQKPVQTEIIDKSDMVRLKSAEQDRRRIVMAQKEKLGMQSMPLTRDRRGGYELPVEIVAKNIWCQAGEYEIIKTLVRDLDRKLFLVSLESESKLIAKPLKVSLYELSKGFRHTFKLNGVGPKFNENVSLSICTDRSKEGKCSDHKAADYPRLEALQSKKPNSPIKEDFTFIFHNLFIKNEEIVAHGAMDYSEAYEKSLSQMLKKEGYEMGTFEKNWKRMKTIRASGATLSRNRLSAYITKNDPNCRMR